MNPFSLYIFFTYCGFSLNCFIQFSRDWFYERFTLMINDIIMIESQSSRKYRNIPNMEINPMENLGSNSSQLQRILSRGIEVKDTLPLSTFHLLCLIFSFYQVLQHHRNGKIYHAIVTFEPEYKQLILRILDQPYLVLFHIQDQVSKLFFSFVFSFEITIANVIFF